MGWKSSRQTEMGKEGREEGGEEATAPGLFAPCSVEPFINYGERAGVVVRSESRRGREGKVGYVDREARSASEASIELASFPVAMAMKPAALSFAMLKRSAARVI